MTLRISVLLALVLALLPVQGALAQNNSADPTQIARQCVRVINSRTDWAVGGMEHAVEGTTHRIRRLAAAGASDREIIAAGTMGAGRVSRISSIATEGIQTVTRRCSAAMIAAGAERTLVARVVAVSDDAQARIAAAADRAHAAIRGVVRRAIG